MTCPFPVSFLMSHVLPISVGEVWSGPVPGHFCWTGDWTVHSQTKFPGPGPGPPGTIYIGLGPSISVWGCLYRSGAVYISLGPSISVWGRLYLSGAIYICLGPSISVWGHLYQSGAVYISLGPSISVWDWSRPGPDSPWQYIYSGARRRGERESWRAGGW